MKNIARLILVLCLVVLLSSCSQNQVDYVVTSKPNQTEASNVERTVQPEMNKLPLFSTITPKIGPTSEQKEIPEGCIELRSESKKDPEDTTLLLADQDSHSTLGLSNGNVSNFIDTPGKARTLIVSPDRKHALVEVCDNKCNYVLRDSDHAINIIPTQNNWVLSQWLDNNRVIIWSLTEPHDLFVLDPFTGLVNTIKVDLYNPYAIQHTPEESLIPISVDPSLDKLFYYDEAFGGRLILWDLKDKQEIVSLPYHVDSSVGFDAWAPNGQQYVTAAPDNRTTTKNALFKIDMDGVLTRLTYYDQNYEFANVTGPAWSPDNRHIAFWVKIGAGTNTNPDELSQYLAVMDIANSETNIYCLTYSTPYYPAFPVIWSPAGNQLIANTRNDQGIVEPVLIDLVDLTKEKIETQGKWVKGWMQP